MFLVESAQKHF